MVFLHVQWRVRSGFPDKVLYAFLGTSAALHVHPSVIFCVHNTGWLAVPCWLWSCHSTFFCSRFPYILFSSIFNSYRIWGSHSDGHEEYCLLGYNVVQSIESQPTFQMNIWPTSSGSKNKASKLCLPLAFTMVSFSAYSSTLKMESICCSETLVDFQRIARRYILEVSTLHVWFMVQNKRPLSSTIPNKKQYKVCIISRCLY
jgi:hypothetical protein